MKNIKGITFIPFMSSGKSETIHVDLNRVLKITEPKMAHRSTSGGAAVYSYFVITFDFPRDDLCISSADVGTFTWAEINEKFNEDVSMIMDSKRHLDQVFRDVYEQWSGKLYVKAQA